MSMPRIRPRNWPGRALVELLDDTSAHFSWDFYADQVCVPCAARRGPCICEVRLGVEAMAWSPGDPTCPEWSRP